MLGGASIAEITEWLSAEDQHFNVMCLALGLNDLVDECNVPFFTYPAHLDDHLIRLSAVARRKAVAVLCLVGGPADIWKYPRRWNYVQRVARVLASGHIQVVPWGQQQKP